MARSARRTTRQSTPRNSGSKGIWRTLNRPLSTRGEQLLAVGGPLLLGLAGFIDVLDGRGYPLWQAPFLVWGLLGVSMWAVRKSRGRS
jgi:hypothetical protein